MTIHLPEGNSGVSMFGISLEFVRTLKILVENSIYTTFVESMLKYDVI